MLTGVSVCDRIEILGMNLGEPPRRVGDSGDQSHTTNTRGNARQSQTHIMRTVTSPRLTPTCTVRNQAGNRLR